MSKAFSSTKPSSLPQPKAIGTSCARKKQSPRSPLQDLNRVSSSSNSSYASSNVSTEAPKGCLRFLSSSSFKTPASHRPKSLSKTPNSVPDAFESKQNKSKPSKENLSKAVNAELQTKRIEPNKARMCRKKNPPCLYQWQSGKKSGSRICQKSRPCSVLNENGRVLPKLLPEPKKLEGKEDRLREINDNGSELIHGNLTPLSKNVRGLSLDSTVHEDVEGNPNVSISITPPINNSVSPEILGGSSLVSTTTPACYGAGYVVSGVTDKRKCRPRGILTVEENYSSFDKTPANSFEDDEKKLRDVVDDNVSPSLLPLPAEALVQWLSSPRNKGKKVFSPKSDSGVNLSQGLTETATLSSSTSPSCSSKSFWNISDSSDLSGAAYCIRRKVSSSISPSGLPEFQVPFNSILSPSYPSILFSSNSILSSRAGSSGKGKHYQYNPIEDNSPFSLNSMGSGNVIQTPQSDSSSDLHVALSLAHADDRKKDSSSAALNSIGEVFLSENFHLNSSAPLEDSVNSSFQFDCLAVPCESIDLSKLPKFSDDRGPWLSGSTIENGSQSQMRISWREGLTSQPYDLDEFDCCRCLSDEEDLANDSSSNRLSAPQVNVEVDGSEKLSSDVVITETEDELEIDGPDREIFPALISYSGSESVSTDGGGLVASKDGSDWTQCYKNKLFDE